MKKQMRPVLFLLMLLTIVLLTVLTASAAGNYSVNGTSYSTLAEAVAAVPSGGTITLTGNTTESAAVSLNLNKSYTIDGGAYTITFGGSQGLNITKGTVTIAGGTFKTTNTACNIVYVNGPVTVHITGGRFVGGNSQVNLTNNGGAVVNISGSAAFGCDGAAVTRALINSNNGGFNSDLTPQKEDTLNILGGTFTGLSSFSHGLINAAGCNVNISGGSFIMPTGTSRSLIRMADGDNISDIKITGGSFTVEGSSNIVEYTGGNSSESSTTATCDRPAGSLTIGGGTFMVKGSGMAVNFTSAKSKDKLPTVSITAGSFYSNTNGTANTLITAKSSKGTLSITGGSFTGDDADTLLSVGSTGSVYVSGGSFYGGRRQMDIGGSADITISGTASFGTNFNGDRLITFYNSANQISNKNKNAVLTINGGTFTLTGRKSTVTEDGETETVLTGEIMFHCNGGDLVINGGSFTLINADTSKTVKQRIFNFTDNDIASPVTVTGGTFTTSDSTVAIFYHAAIMASKRTGGVFDANGLGDITISGSPVFDATAGGRILNIATGKLYPFTVNIAGGTFKGNDDCLIWYNNPCPESALCITGGTFILQESSLVTGGAILRTGIDPYSGSNDPTEVYFINAAPITISGGIFVDQRSGNEQILDLRIGAFPLSIKGAVLLSSELQPYFIIAGNAEWEVTMSARAATCLYGGKTYYLYMTDGAVGSSLAPVLGDGAQVRTVADSEGIRFTSTVPATAVAALEQLGTVTYGTLIAPADFVAAAGGFTVEKLTAYAAKCGYATPERIFVNVIANRSLQRESDGSVSFNAALVNIKEGNRNRNFAAVSYAKVGATYYYSTYNLSDNARSIKTVAEEALKDVSTVASTVYASPSIYDANAYSRYTTAVQQALQGYCGLAPISSASVNFSAYSIVYDTALSSNCRQKVSALQTKLGITVCNGNARTNEVLIGHTNRTETATALAKISGDGYYIGVIGEKVVIVGTTNALTMMAVDAFSALYGSRSATVKELIASDLSMYTMSGDTVFVFSHQRDGNLRENSNITYNYASLFKGHAYATEKNPYLVDYPVVAALQICDALVPNNDSYTVVPDNVAMGGFRIHVGLTKGATAYLNTFGNDVNAYGYKIHDGEIFITSYNDQTLRKAVALFLEAITDFATTDENGNTVYRIPVGYEGEAHATLSSSDWITDVPLPELTLSGSIDVYDNSYQYYYTGEGINVAAYQAYCNTLTANGYTLYSESEAADNIFRIYVNGSKTRTVYTAYSGFGNAATQPVGLGNDLSSMFTAAIRVIVGELDGLHLQLLEEELLRPQTNYTKITDTKITSMQLKQGNIGNCYIFTLEDGSFVVMDGGDTVQDDYTTLWNVLNALYEDVHGHAPTAAEPITLAAWFLSHGHGDHYASFYKFCQIYGSQIVIERLITNFASNDELYNGYNCNPTLRNQLGTAKTTDWIRDMNGDVPYYKVHTGQRFYLRNVEFEVLYTHEDLYPWNLAYFNETSTVVRTTIQNTNGSGSFVGTATTALWFGDGQFRTSQCMRAMYGDYLKSDMVQVSHHGGSGVEGEIYELINAKYIWWPTRYSTIAGANASTNAANRALLDNTDWAYIVIHDEYNVTVTFTSSGPDFSLTSSTGLKNIADTEDCYPDDDEDGINIVYGGFVVTPETLKNIN